MAIYDDCGNELPNEQAAKKDGKMLCPKDTGKIQKNHLPLLTAFDLAFWNPHVY